MKKAGKNSPAPTSSGKEPLKEEVKASNHLEIEEDSNVSDVNNDQKIKVLEQQVTDLGAQLQHFHSEWQATAAVTMEVRDLLQSLKTTNKESPSTPTRDPPETHTLDEEGERLRFLQDVNAAKATKKAENSQREKRAKFTPRKDDTRMKSLENERPSYFPEELWNLLGGWEKQQCVFYQRVYLGLSESTEENPCEAEKQGLHLLELHKAGILRSGRKIFRDGTLTLTTGRKVKANLYWLALQLAKMKQWPAVINMEPEQQEKVREAERKQTLLYDESYMKAEGIISDPAQDYSSKKPLAVVGGFGPTEHSSDEGTDDDYEYLEAVSENPVLRKDSIGKRALMQKEKNKKKAKRKKEKEKKEKKERPSWLSPDSSSEEGESWGESESSEGEYDVKNPPDVHQYFERAKFKKLTAACFLVFEETAKRYCNYGKTASGIFEKRWHELVSPNVFLQLYNFNYMGLERKHFNVVLGKVFNKTTGGPAHDRAKNLVSRSVVWDDMTRPEYLEYDSLRGLALLYVVPKDAIFFVTALEQIMRDRWPSKDRSELQKIHTTTISNIMEQYPVYTAFLRDYLATFLSLKGGVNECVEKWGLDKYDIPWEGHVGMEKSMAKTFKELGNEPLLVILHMVVNDIKENKTGEKKKVQFSFERVMNGVTDWFSQEYQLAQESNLLDKKKDVITQRFFPNSVSSSRGKASGHLEVLEDWDDGYACHHQVVDWDTEESSQYQEFEATASSSYADLEEYAALYSGNSIKGRDWKSYCFCKIFGKPCSGKCKKESDDPVDGLKAASYLEHQQEEKIKMLSERLVAIKAFKQAREKELKLKNRYDPAFSIWPRGPQVASQPTANRQSSPFSTSKPSIRPPPKVPYTFAKRPAAGLNSMVSEQQHMTPLRDFHLKLPPDEATQNEEEGTHENEGSEFDEFASF